MILKPEPQLNKELLEAIVRLARDSYVNTLNSDGVQYLNSQEIVALTYVEATLSALKARGFEVKPVSKD